MRSQVQFNRQDDLFPETIHYYPQRDARPGTMNLERFFVRRHFEHFLSSANWSHVSILKPVPIVPQVVKNLCPYCGKASYSRDGIHPQCALQRADDARNARIRAERKKVVKPEKPRHNWLSKKCPQCGAQLHVRVNRCTCGHAFAARPE
jgi:predicted RNA-binding Zn-ribbon protein involved in translation (DUF1610 family)